MELALVNVDFGVYSRLHYITLHLFCYFWQKSNIAAEFHYYFLFVN